MTLALNDEALLLRRFLRQAVKLLHDEGIAIPVAMADWWREEQQRIQAEKASIEAERQRRRQELLTLISNAQTELASL